MNNDNNIIIYGANDLEYTKGELTGIISSPRVDSYNTSMSDEALEEIVSQGVGKLVSFEHTNDTSSMIGKVREVSLLPDKRVKFRASISKPYHKIMNDLFNSGVDFGFSIGNLTDKFKTTLINGKEIITSLNGFDHFAVTLSPANLDTLNTGSFRSFVNGEIMVDVNETNIIKAEDLQSMTQGMFNEFKDALMKEVKENIDGINESVNSSLTKVLEEFNKNNEANAKTNKEFMDSIKELNTKMSDLESNASKDNTDDNDEGVKGNEGADEGAGEGRSQAVWQKAMREYQPHTQTIIQQVAQPIKSRRDINGRRIFD